MSNLHTELNSFNDSGFAQGRRKTNETFVELTGHGTFWRHPTRGCAAVFFLRVSVCDTGVSFMSACFYE